MRGKLGDGVRHRSTRARRHGDCDYDEMSCLIVIGIFLKAGVGFLSGRVNG